MAEPSQMIDQKTASAVGLRAAIGTLFMLAGMSLMAAAVVLGVGKVVESEPIPESQPIEQLRDVNALARANGAVELQPGYALGYQVHVADPSETSFTSLKDRGGRELRLTLNDQSPGSTVIFGSTASNLLVKTNANFLALHATSSEPQRVDPYLIEALNADSSGSERVIIRYAAAKNKSLSKRSRTIAEQKKIEQKTKTLFVGTRSRVHQSLRLIGAVVAEVDRPGLQRLLSDRTIERVSLDRKVQADLDESVPLIRANEAWVRAAPNNTPVMGQGATIAIIDTGIDYTLPEFGNCTAPLDNSCTKVIGGYNFAYQNDDPFDDNGHGTHVAATAAGNGRLLGVAPQASLYAYKVLSSGGWGYTSDIILALERSTDPNQDGNTSDHVDVANLSLGGWGDPDDDMSLAVDEASENGVVMVISAGNSGPYPSTIGSPGTARSAITVAASCKPGSTSSYCYGTVAEFSSRGPLIWNGVDLQKPDVAAPGVEICAARAPGLLEDWPDCGVDEVALAGTSMAAPHVTGVVALILQAEPSLTPDQVKSKLRNTAKTIHPDINAQGAGEVVAANAVAGTLPLAVSPGQWDITSNPTQGTSNSSQIFTLPSGTSVTGLQQQAILNVPGVTIAFDEEYLLNRTTRVLSVSAQASINNAVAKPGTYHGWAEFRRNGSLIGTVLINVTVQATLVMAPSTKNIDYGIDNPTLTSWDSDPQIFTLTNRRTDIAQTVSTTVSGLLPQVTYDLPTTITVPANSTIEVPTSLHVNNQLWNGEYHFPVKLISGPNQIMYTASFLKYYVVDVVIDDFDPNLFYWVQVHDQNFQNILNTTPEQRSTFYFDQPGPYDTIVTYPGVDDPGSSRYFLPFVFSENNQPVNGYAEIHVAQPVDYNEYRISGSDIDGNFSSSGYAFIRPHFYDSNGFRNPWLPGFLEIVNQQYASMVVNNISSAYEFQSVLVQPPTSPVEEQYYFASSIRGIQDDTYPAISSSELVPTYFESIVPIPQPTIPLTYLCWVGACASSIDYSNPWEYPRLQTTWSNLSDYETTLSHYTDFRYEECPEFGYCPNIFWSPLIFPPTGERSFYFQNPDVVRALPTMEGQTEYNGLGPSYWTGEFNVQPLYMEINSTDHFFGTALRRQDYSLQGYAPIDYTLKRNGIAFASGQLPSQNPRYYIPFNPIVSVPLGVSGNYEFSTTFEYLVWGTTAYQGSYTGSFSSGLTDPNPPALTQLYFKSQGERSQAYDPNLINQIEISLDPIGGTLIAPTVSLDQPTVIANLPYTLENDVYRVTLPSGLSGDRISVKIIAQDISGNTSRWTFELPIGSSIYDPIPPTAQLIAPTGTEIAQGTIQIQAIASDNQSVATVEFLQDGLLIGVASTGTCDSTNVCTYTYSYNTRLTTNGTHAYTARVTDRQGNSFSTPITYASVQNVTIQKKSPGSPKKEIVE